jgi:hypothetical protein
LDGNIAIDNSFWHDKRIIQAQNAGGEFPNSNGSYNYLDRSLNPSAPSYDPDYGTHREGSEQISIPVEVRMTDSPGLNSYDNYNDTMAIGFSQFFRVFLAIRYDQFDQNGDATMNVVYSLGYTEWEVHHRAGSYVPNVGPTSTVGSSISYWLSMIKYNGNDIMAVGTIAKVALPLLEIPGS